MSKLKDPIFLLALVLLLLNDHVLKIAFHNGFTGKLSDFAGVYVFAFFFSAGFPGKAKIIHLLTALFFVFWKTELSQPFIDWANDLGWPVGRMVDPTDLIALAVLPFSLKRSGARLPRLFPMHPALTAVIVLFALFATSMPPRIKKEYIHINQRYEFDFPVKTLAQKLNMLVIRELGKYHYSQVEYVPDSNIFVLIYGRDTLTGLIDVQKLSNRDTVFLPSSFAEITIEGDEVKSALTLLKTARYISPFKDKDYVEKTIKFFERKVIKKLKAP